jgi:RimJ/RimL family protein N-acetyltransferase/DNA-binding transcriptional ArsR family regulator
VSKSSASSALHVPAARRVTSVATLKALADPVRLAILTALMADVRDLRVMSVKELAAELGEPQTKLYRHVRQLEMAGLIRVAATRVVSGILEYRYQACQASLAFGPGLVRDPDPPSLVLHGSLVRLEPLRHSHVPDLMLAAEEDRSGYGYTMVPRANGTAEYVAAQLARDGLTPFAQIRASDERAVGCTSYCNPRTWPGREDLYAIEIGGTWLAASAQRTGINTEAKLLLLEYAFETLSVVRVDFKTDARNQRSRQAIERAGARFEGVLRNWSPSWVPGEEGKLRDSAIFSVTEAEWPAVKSSLVSRITT